MPAAYADNTIASIAEDNQISSSDLSENDYLLGNSFSPQAECLFVSKNIGLLTKGIYKRLSTSAADGKNRDSYFHKEIQRSLAQASHDGIKNPIVIGAIPFDTEQPSCLLIPESTQKIRMDDLSSIDTVSMAFSPDDMQCIPDETGYKRGVRTLLDCIKSGRIEKAVLAKRLELSLGDNVDMRRILDGIIRQNPGKYHFSIPIEDGSVFMGASPELLIRKHDSHLCSNPLAGSVKRQSHLEQDDKVSAQLLASSKDIHEHRIVIDEIERELRPFCVALDVPAKPTLISTATMWHLSTQINGVVNDPCVSSLHLACALHPTPAVCGFPSLSSKKLIGELEEFDRNLFAGMVGWCDAKGNGEWVVSIRCGQVYPRKISLFAGAGIVAGSCPDAEWAETDAKLKTMLNAIGLSIN